MVMWGQGAWLLWVVDFFLQAHEQHKNDAKLLIPVGFSY